MTLLYYPILISIRPWGKTLLAIKDPAYKSVSFIDAGDTWRGAPSRATFREHDGADKWQDPPLF